jgi:endosialidase-like protein
MNPFIELQKTIAVFFIALVCFGLSPASKAVNPPPDGGYPNFNTAEGHNALLNLTSGANNTALGFNALLSDTTGSNHTAVGSQALYNNATSRDDDGNTAVVFQALYSNTTGDANNAFGSRALYSNMDGVGNVAVGGAALSRLTSGGSNTAVGNGSLIQSGTVNFNTALGRRALFRTQADQNTGLGFFAESNLNEGGTNNIYIGNVGPVPIGSESNTIRIGTQTATTATIGNPPVESHPMPAHTATYIAGIMGKSTPRGTLVFINANAQLGTVQSSARFKEQIKPMGNASEAIRALKPVTFRYKKEIDPERTPEFGLVAEDVEKVNPDLVVSHRTLTFEERVTYQRVRKSIGVTGSGHKSVPIPSLRSMR